MSNTFIRPEGFPEVLPDGPSDDDPGLGRFPQGKGTAPMPPNAKLRRHRHRRRAWWTKLRRGLRRRGSRFSSGKTRQPGEYLRLPRPAGFSSDVSPPSTATAERNGCQEPPFRGFPEIGTSVRAASERLPGLYPDDDIAVPPERPRLYQNAHGQIPRSGRVSAGSSRT